ncbi:hypothetical protein J4526_02125 [Desulfurococcaceae archaeon MEX13E-LK6-19]|nr:hypothetical protein J4526_02125 [Desulfurococcaceae archaeon MEX13E-LK6-19]
MSDKLGKRLIVILKGFPCSWGKCSFCPFSLEQSTNIREVIETNRRIINKALELIRKDHYERVAVFNGGSFHELPFDTIEKLRDLAMNRVFEIETRSEFVTLDSLKNILSFYKPKKLIVRLGFEVYDEEIREKLLKKGMPNTELERIVNLRNKVKELGLPIEFWCYVLFGIEYIPEEKVVESVNVFRKMFDGIIAIKYKKYLPSHPNETPVSPRLAQFLENNVDLVDWGGEQWEIKKEKKKN